MPTSRTCPTSVKQRRENMARKSFNSALVAIIAVAASGCIAHWVWAEPYLTIVAAALGAAASVLIWIADEDIDAAPGGRLPSRTLDPATHGQRLIAQMVQAVPFGAFTIHEDGTIHTINQQAKRIFGVPEASGLPVATLRKRRLLDLIEQVQSGKPDGQTELSLTRQTEAHLVAHVSRIAKVPGQARGVPSILVLIEDQTRYRKTGALHRDFVANASHELKTPLAAISATVETLQGHAREDPEATERFLKILFSQSSRMTRLVNDLLSLNRIELNERVEPEDPQDLFAVIHEVVDILSPMAADAGVDLKVLTPDTSPTVIGDRDELAQIFQNLIENAIRYGASGKEVLIGLSSPSEAHPHLVGVTVQDRGPGIDPEHIPRLTERFYRVSVASSREKGGTGLGLAIVKHIVNRHRGRLEIRSAPGEGSAFTVWLRRTAAHDNTVIRESEPAELK